LNQRSLSETSADLKTARNRTRQHWNKKSGRRRRRPLDFGGDIALRCPPARAFLSPAGRLLKIPLAKNGKAPAGSAQRTDPTDFISRQDGDAGGLAPDAQNPAGFRRQNYLVSPDVRHRPPADRHRRRQGFPPAEVSLTSPN